MRIRPQGKSAEVQWIPALFQRGGLMQQTERVAIAGQQPVEWPIGNQWHRTSSACQLGESRAVQFRAVGLFGDIWIPSIQLGQCDWIIRTVDRPEFGLDQPGQRQTTRNPEHSQDKRQKKQSLHTVRVPQRSPRFQPDDRNCQ